MDRMILACFVLGTSTCRVASALLPVLGEPVSATREELGALAMKLLDPQKLQVSIVGGKSIRVRKKDGTELTLEEDLKALAKTLGLPYKELALR